MKLFRIGLYASFLMGFSSSLAQNNPLPDLLQSDEEVFQKIVAVPDKHQLQILYTQIDRDENNQPTFTTFEYGLDEKLYFYPASTVKMPTAAVALEKLNALDIIGLDKYTTMLTGKGHAPQTPVRSDTTAVNGLPSVAHYIKKIFVVSDNDAYNRLYEFIGQEDLNQALRAKGFDATRIIHRLSAPGYDVEANRYTNPVSFYDENGKLLYHQGERYTLAETDFDLEKSVRGKGYMNSQGEIVNEPFDFRTKNYVSLRNLHDMLKVLLFPESVPEEQRFDLTTEDYRFLHQFMATLPGESRHPYYGDKPDGYVKFFLYGGATPELPEHIRIFNKVGDAYGFLTDVAYVVDFENKVEFLLAANVLVNENAIFNDGVYEYEALGFPFLTRLGQKIHELERKRKRQHEPDLSYWQRLWAE